MRSWPRCCAAAILLLFTTATPLQAQPSQGGAAPSAPVPVERFFQRPAVLEAKLSPSGKYVAVTSSRGIDRIGLVVYEFGVGARRIAQFPDLDIVRFDWVSDSRLVYSVLDLESGSGDDRREQPGLFAVNVDGQNHRQLIRRRSQPTVTNGDPRDRLLDWYHLLLHVPLQQEGVRPNEIVIGRLNLAGDRSVDSVTPMWLDTASGRTRHLDTHGEPDNTVNWMFDSKGQPRVAISRSKGASRLHWLGPGESQWRQISEGQLDRLRFSPRAVDDSGTLWGTHTEGREAWSVLTRFDFEAMKPQAPPLVRAPGFDFRGSLVLDRPGGRALGVRVETDAEQTVWFDEAMKKFQVEVDEKMPGRVNRISCRRCGESDMTALVRSYADRDPGLLLVYQAAEARWIRVGALLDEIEPQRMASVALHRIKARDGRDLPVWLTTPAKAQPGQALPAVVLVHGGPWLRGGFWRWEAMQQFLASRGYLVIAPEFRGSAGYGFAHYKAGWKQWGQAMQDDVADALLWAQSQGLAAKDRACIAGASYGGYSTLMGLVRQPELYRCGVAWAALTDPFLYLEGSWFIDDDIASDGRRYYMPELVGDAEKDRAMLSANSPLLQAARITAPLLLGFGDADRRVPLAHGKRLREALIAAGRPPEWVVYDNEAHGWRQLKNQIDWALRVEKFLAQHLGGSEAPSPAPR
ncbi:alpha/beta hydrolase family protein [Roseateles violae]|uniref:Prolyl oligopeptidase family serine peptidase n=1 Tax=Roseateles violae TaxID=3058042 RepID=A0ABT8DQX9_9BURK|nr:prolyl oligopeptidase family serine peptidase [Pelomonas sp. PFR6]MDN3920750.1 prolyl oligopeptidase family serine peptidase [Pelomonas sp. PFR6]